MLVIAIATVLLTIVGATYAYFIVVEGTSMVVDVGAQTSRVDSLTFSVDKDIYVHTKQEDFKEGSGNVSDYATATATLMAATGEEPRYTYNVFISVYENTFMYTTEEEKTELLLKVTGPDGEVTKIEGLTYDESLQGFDITTKEGLIPISLDQEITTTTEKIDKWHVEVILVNLDSDQTPNATKTFDAEVKIQHEGYKIATIGDVKTTLTATSIKIDVTAKNGDGKIKNYYYCLDENECVETTNSIYTFEKLNPVSNYNLKVYVKDSDGQSSVEFVKSIKTLAPTSVADVCESGTALESCIKMLYTTDGTGGLYYHDGTGTYTNASLEAGDKAYRFSGVSTSIKNYVCLGSVEENCSVDNLYRIIGSFPTDETLKTYEVKLIKDISIGNYQWSGSTSNTLNDWSESTLRTDILNSTTGAYWKTLGMDANKIFSHNRVVSGGPESNGVLYYNNAQIAYNYEVAKECKTCPNKEQYTILANKVGLMYVSDYLYSASPVHWSKSGYSMNSSTYPDYRTAWNDNWLYSRTSGWNNELTISRNTSNIEVAYVVNNAGYTTVLDTNSSRSGYVSLTRPCIYLNSNVKYSSGIGTSTDPIRLS